MYAEDNLQHELLYCN